MRFHVLTFNVFKLGGPVPPEIVVNRILSLTPRPDLIGLQEVFNTRTPLPGGNRARNARKILRRRLQAAGYRTLWLATGGPPPPLHLLTFGCFRDGLMIAVATDRFRLEQGGSDLSAILRRKRPDRRGAQGVVVRESGGLGRRIAFVNCHLSVGVTDERRRRRELQITELLRFVVGVAEAASPAATVLVGDFNSQEGQSELARLTGSEGGFEDTFRRRNPDDPGFTRDRETNSLAAERRVAEEEEDSSRIDYVFLRPPGDGDPVPAVTAEGSRVVLRERYPDAASGESLSDHYGVLTSFELA